MTEYNRDRVLKAAQKLQKTAQEATLDVKDVVMAALQEMGAKDVNTYKAELYPSGEMSVSLVFPKGLTTKQDTVKMQLKGKFKGQNVKGRMVNDVKVDMSTY